MLKKKGQSFEGFEHQGRDLGTQDRSLEGGGEWDSLCTIAFFVFLLEIRCFSRFFSWYIVYFLRLCVLRSWRYAFTFRSFVFSGLWWNLCFCIPNSVGSVIFGWSFRMFLKFFLVDLMEKRKLFSVCLLGVYL